MKSKNGKIIYFEGQYRIMVWFKCLPFNEWFYLTAWNWLSGLRVF